MRLINITVCCFWCCIVLHTQNIYAQIAELDSLKKSFDVYRTKTLQEKIYVHLDQNFYLIGESAWFKIYCVDGSTHKPLDISKVAYIELIDRSNTAVLQAKIELANGFGNGAIFFPATLQSGSYKI